MMRLLAVLAAFVACSPPPSPKPIAAPVAVARPPAPSRVVTERFKSEALGVEKDVWIYLPKGYDPDGTKRWPVYYYLHGLGGNEANWVEGVKLDAAANAVGLAAIIVMPDGDNSFYIDSKLAIDYDACMKDGKGLFIATQPKETTCVKASKYETYITRDLIGWVDRTYKTIATREGRGIAGISMGGFGALVLSLRHTDLFVAAASHSGLDALLYMGPHPYEKGKQLLFSDPKVWAGALRMIGLVVIADWMLGLFGEDIANWRAYDPVSLVDKLPPGKLKLYIDCGTDDEFLFHNGMQYLHDVLLEKQHPHEYWIGPGHHSFDFFTERAPHGLKFLQASVAAAK